MTLHVRWPDKVWRQKKERKTKTLSGNAKENTGKLPQKGK